MHVNGFLHVDMATCTHDRVQRYMHAHVVNQYLGVVDFPNVQLLRQSCQDLTESFKKPTYIIVKVTAVNFELVDLDDRNIQSRHTYNDIRSHDRSSNQLRWTYEGQRLL